MTNSGKEGKEKSWFSNIGWIIWLTTALSIMPLAAAQSDPLPTIRERMGGGNLTTHIPAAIRPYTANVYRALRLTGARSARMNSYGWRTTGHTITPGDFEASMLEAYKNGIKPIILFEYDGSYQFLNPPHLIGAYNHWYQVGRTYATRFRPGGTWAVENGAGNWGVSIFTAMNEPDLAATISRVDYRNALEGLADGVHSVDPNLKVVPGGYTGCSYVGLEGDLTFRGYGTAIAPLLNNGKLDGIDIHTYYNARWFPMTTDGRFSAQYCFDKVKAAIGVTRDINFYATEFNVAREEGYWNDDATIGSLFLTGLWDHLGIVGQNNRSAAVIAFPWNLAETGSGETENSDAGQTNWAMATNKDEEPWAPDVRSEVMNRVLSLAGDMKFVSLDPVDTATWVLEDSKARLAVFSNLNGWTSIVGNTWTVTAPAWATTAELWSWDGRRKSVPLSQGKFIVTDLEVGHTYMLLMPKPQ